LEHDAPLPDLALALRKASLHWSTRLFTGLFAIGSLMGLEPLLRWEDPGAFFAPFLVFVVSAVAAWDSSHGRESRSRMLLTGVILLYVTILISLAPDLVRLAIGFPFACLSLLLFHLIYHSREATRIGWVLTGLITVGYGAMMLSSTHPETWTVLTSCAVQVLVLAFANRVLDRLGRGWEEALGEASIARAELAAAYQLSIEASHAKSAFLASMSHELRTPLNAVIGYAELAEDQLEAEGTADADDLRRIQRAGQHLLDLVNQVLDLSRVEAGHIELQKTRVDLAAVAREVCDTLRPQVQQRSNKLKVQCFSVLPIELDALRTRQIITNLLGNAAKFTEHGTVTVTVQHNEDRLELSIEDTGTGIPEDRLDHIFEAFEQADDSIQRTHGGTGLGLAISRRLAREMGGEITVSSTLDQGSRFVLSFPLHKASRGTPPVAKRVTAA